METLLLMYVENSFYMVWKLLYSVKNILYCRDVLCVVGTFEWLQERLYAKNLYIMWGRLHNITTFVWSRKPGYGFRVDYVMRSCVYVVIFVYVMPHSRLKAY